MFDPTLVKDLKGDEVVAFNTGEEPWPGPAIAKHYGPGRHPGTGTEQTIHGSGLLSPATGRGRLKGQPVFKYLVNSDGTPWTYTATPTGPIFMRVNDKLTDITSKHAGVVKAMYATGKKNKLDVSPEAIDRNFDRLLESALARYKADKSLADKDRFYELWHESLYELSQETGIEYSRVVAAAAAISPGLDAERNLHFAHDLARWVSNEERIVFKGKNALALADDLDAAGQTILSPTYNAEFHKIPEGKSPGDPRPAPGAARAAMGQELVDAATQIKESGSIRLADLEPYAAAYTLHKYRKTVGPAGELLGEARNVYMEPPEWSISQPGTRVGFDASKGYRYYSHAIATLRGDMDQLDALGDVKLRTFHNNIMDPLNSSGRNEVTIDYHGVNFGTFSVGADKNTGLIASPAYEGVKLGVRPLVADGMRRAASRWGKKFPDGTIPSRIQEIAWAEWRRGLKDLTWTSYATGETIELPYTGKGIWRQDEGSDDD